MAKYHIQHTIMLKLDTEITIPNGLTEEEANEKLREAIYTTLGKLATDDTSNVWHICDFAKTKTFSCLGTRVYKIKRGGWWEKVHEHIHPKVKELYNNLF